MTYDPTIPAAGDILSQSQVDIQDNFAAIGALFGSNATADHHAFNDATSALRGLHKRITMPGPLASAPVPVSTEGFLYPFADPNDVNTRTQLYFKNVTDTFQVTNKFQSASANGYIMLAGGIILMWGNKSGSIGSGAHSLTFNTIADYTGAPLLRFPNNCFGVWCNPYNAAADVTAKTVKVQISTLANTGCTVLVSGGIDGYYWFAIGN